MIVDSKGRKFKKLRVSLTHECNYSCVYCVYDNKPDHAAVNNYSSASYQAKPLPSSDLIEIIRNLHRELKLGAVRLTGGEPLLYPRLVSIITAICDMGIANIGMTTNGHLLYNKAKMLYSAGLRSVNISLDALSEDTFIQMSRYNGLSRVMKSIDAALDNGLNVKLNTVVVAGRNNHEILPLLHFAMRKGIIIRFLELMPMGPLHERRDAMFFSSSQILEVIQSEYPIEALPGESGATADYWSISGKKAFGIIANDSSPFCNDCNRLRLDSYGNIYGCLSSLIPVPVSPTMTSDAMRSSLKLALTHKQTTHFVGNNRTMQSIGG